MKKCAYADRYRALRAPRCNGGDPCNTCRDKWDAAQEKQSVGESGGDDAWAEAFVSGAIVGGLLDF